MKDGKLTISQRNDELGVSTIKAQHQNKEKGEVVIHDREEFFYYPLGIGVLFLLQGFGSLPRRGSMPLS